MIILHLITWVGLFIWYQQMRKKEKKKLYRRIFLFAVAGNFLGAAVTVAYEYAGRSETEPILERSALGGQPMEENWVAVTEDGDQYDVVVTVPALTYSDKEVEEYLDAAVRQLDEAIFSSITMNHVDQDLNLISSLPDNPTVISWRSSRSAWVDDRGKLSDEIPVEGAEVTLEATLSLQGAADVFQRTLRVYPPVLSETDQMLREIQKQMEQINSDSTKKQYYLPLSANGKKLRWIRNQDHTGIMILGFTLLIAVLLGAQDIQEEVQRRKRREESLMQDYPELISEIVLLMGAGLTMRKIIERIALDYRRKIERGYLRKEHAGYEEIRVCWQEMEHGISEINAYEHLGERCGIRMYRSLTVILVQNLRKGNKGLLELLKKEAQEAQEERRRRARVAGETAGTRMLLPMGMMLVVVLMILTVPALLSLNA